MIIKMEYFMLFEKKLIIIFVLVISTYTLFAENESVNYEYELKRSVDSIIYPVTKEDKIDIASEKYNLGNQGKVMLLWRTSLLFGEYRGVETGLNIGYYINDNWIFIHGIGYLHYSTKFIQPEMWPTIQDVSDINQEIWAFVPFGFMYPIQLKNMLWIVPSVSSKVFLKGSSVGNRIPALSNSTSIDFAVNTSYSITKHLALGLDLKLSYGTPLSKAENVQYPASYTSVGLNCIYLF